MRDLNDREQELALRLAHVLLPDYVDDCEPWEWHDGAWRRLFTVKEWQVGAVLVAVSGEQTHCGDVELWVYVGGEEQLVGTARQRLTDALIQAGQLLDGIGRGDVRDWPRTSS
jgi:hypothetical protein